MIESQPPDSAETSWLPLIVIAGPTASGKTALSVELAIRCHGEIVNADSRYLYRGMDIGVAKPDIVERRGVPHHLIDIRNPDQDMSLATYQELAMTAIRGVHARGRLPMLVGGTPLYINAVVEGWRITRVPPHPELRARFESDAAQLGVEAMSERLAAVDPLAAERSGRNLRRIIRALEIHAVTGRPMSELEGKGPRPFDTLELGLSLPRERLHAAIHLRVRRMIEQGLVGEVQALLEGGLDPEASSMSSLGYRQLVPYLKGEVTLEEAIDRIETDTRRYVRHQETWLRKNPNMVTLDAADPDLVERAEERIRRFLNREVHPSLPQA